jgi:hypothetical protein
MIISTQQVNGQYAWEARREDGEPKEISFMAGFANSKDTIPDSIRRRFGDGMDIHFQNVELWRGALATLTSSVLFAPAFT